MTLGIEELVDKLKGFVGELEEFEEGVSESVSVYGLIEDLKDNIFELQEEQDEKESLN